MKCPECNLTNPPETIRCDCGYNFKAGTTGVKRNPVNEVVIKDINMSFGSMILFMVKWAFAAIPAIIIITITISFIMMLITAFFSVITSK